MQRQRQRQSQSQSHLETRFSFGFGFGFWLRSHISQPHVGLFSTWPHFDYFYWQCDDATMRCQLLLLPSHKRRSAQFAFVCKFFYILILILILVLVSVFVLHFSSGLLRSPNGRNLVRKAFCHSANGQKAQSTIGAGTRHVAEGTQTDATRC